MVMTQVINRIKKWLGIDAKSIWVKRNVYSYGISSNDWSGSVKRTRSHVKTYYNSEGLSDEISQLKERMQQMSFHKGFWFLKTKANELGLEFNYVRMI